MMGIKEYMQLVPHSVTSLQRMVVVHSQ